MCPRHPPRVCPRRHTGVSPSVPSAPQPRDGGDTPLQTDARNGLFSIKNVFVKHSSSIRNTVASRQHDHQKGVSPPPIHLSHRDTPLRLNAIQSGVSPPSPDPIGCVPTIPPASHVCPRRLRRFRRVPVGSVVSPSVPSCPRRVPVVSPSVPSVPQSRGRGDTPSKKCDPSNSRKIAFGQHLHANHNTSLHVGSRTPGVSPPILGNRSLDRWIDVRYTMPSLLCPHPHNPATGTHHSEHAPALGLTHLPHREERLDATIVF